MADCLIVTAMAAEFAREVDRLTEGAVTVTACKSATEAREAYAGETVLFGNPSEIAPLLEDWPDVAWVQSSWAGVTPLIAAARRDYQLTGVKGVFGPQMSEYVFGYLLAHELRLLERHQAQQRRAWLGTHSGVLQGKTLGIMGTGSIGAHIAGTASAFGMTAVGLSRSGKPVSGFTATYAVADLAEFLRQADGVVAALPGTRDTDRLLNAETLGLLQRGAYFINVGRSNVVDDAALIDALASGQLGGAALDVFDEEPLPDTSPLWQAPNLRITAHIAAISHPRLIVPIFVDNYRRYVDGKPLEYVVDFAAGY